MLFIRSFLFYCGMGMALLVWTIILTPLILPFPYQKRYRIISGWAYFITWWLEKTCRISYQVEGTENIPKSAAIILSKHQSAWETIVFQKIFPPQVWVLKRELFWIPFFGWALKSLNPIAIRRKNLRQSMQEIIEQGKDRLAKGIWVVIFPEGTRVAVGETKRYGVGGAMLAEKTGYPIVPVAHNAGKFWPRSSLIKYPGTVKVVIGPVIDPKGKDYKEINQLVEEWIEGTMGKL